MLKSCSRFFLLACCVFLLSACGKDTPEKATMEWMDSIAAGDFQRATELSSPTAAPLIGFMEMAAMSMSAAEREEAFAQFSGPEHVSTRIDGDRAEVVMRVDGVEDSIDMIRIDGQWLVDINKDNMDK